MALERRSLPEEAELWWQDLPNGRYAVTLQWRGGITCQLGILQTNPLMFRYDPSYSEPAIGQKGTKIEESKLSSIWGQALTRAGFLLPAMETAMLQRLISLREDTSKRLEFILDTNAMVEGIGHWLARLFADRCDMVTTAVTLRELQDKQDQSKWSDPLKTWNPDQMSSRHVYLASMRFREFPEAGRILWRELEMDDTALLLARGGKDGKKTSESDTAILRNVRRSIQDRVHGLERFFVTGDTGLARRATTELPEGSVISAHVRPLKAGVVYTPTSWWPGADQGRTFPRPSAVRLVWELLCAADSIELKALDQTRPAAGQTWTLTAFCKEMWPSDYRYPWLAIDEKPGDAAGPAKPSIPVPDVPVRSRPSTADMEQTLFPPSPWPALPDDTRNYRFSAALFLDALYALVGAKLGDVIIWPGRMQDAHEDTWNSLLRMLEALELLARNNNDFFPKDGAMLTTLRAVWAANDWNALGTLLYPYCAFREIISLNFFDSANKRPQTTREFGRSLAAQLGQGLRISGNWYPGGENPSMTDIRRAVVNRFEHPASDSGAYPVVDLFEEVFLKQLGVSPARAIERWTWMETCGVFAGIEFRKGGSSTGKHVQKIVRLSPQGWDLDTVDYETVQGYRDLKNQGALLDRGALP